MHVELCDRAVEIDASGIEAPEEVVREQIAEYAADDRRAFDLSVTYPDSFTGAVMEAMAAVPYGETRTYGDLAAELDTAPIAVGRACGRNPVPIVVPCHRVVGADSLGGYSAASGPEFKRRLLALES